MKYEFSKKTTFALLFGALLPYSGMATAQLSNSCNALLQHGINNITKYKSADHAIAYKWDKHCRIDQQYSSDSVVNNADAEIFDFSGSNTLNVEQKRQRVIDFCEEHKAFAQQNSDLVQEAKLLSVPALNAWEQCVRMARKDIRITMTANGNYDQFVHFEIDSSHDGDLRFLGIVTTGYQCETAMVRDGDNIETSDQPYIRNSNIQIDCKRTEPITEEVSGVGTVKYDPASISVNTSGPSLAVAFPEIVSNYYVTPPGSVLAFNSKDCPAGWSKFTDAENRFILGAGSEFEHSKKGGTKTIPSQGGHKHTTGGMSDLGPRHPHGHARDSSSNQNHSHGTDSKGAHDHGGNNMPPFVALQYCQRDLPTR